MQLDRTQVAIRERSLSQLLDLSLLICRHYGKGLLATAAVGVIPFALLNLVACVLILEAWEAWDDLIAVGNIYGGLVMAVLVYIEAPLALSPTTAYLGQAVFVARPKWADIARDIYATLWPLLYCQGLLRWSLVAPMAGLALSLIGWLDPYDEWTPIRWLFIIIALLIAVGARASRPYLIEMIVLEKNPLRSSSPAGLTLARRSRALHAADENRSATWLAAGVASILLLIVVAGMMVFLQELVFGTPHWGHWLFVVAGYPLALWAVALFMTVFRFLKYLDVRIRSEGWEVELLLRAEAERWEHR